MKTSENTLLHAFLSFFLPTRASCTVILCQHDRVKPHSQKLRRWWKSAIYMFYILPKFRFFLSIFLLKFFMTLARAICVCYGVARGHTSYGVEMRLTCTWNNKSFSASSTSVYFHLCYHVEFGFICDYWIVLRDVVNRKLCEKGWSFATCSFR